MIRCKDCWYRNRAKECQDKNDSDHCIQAIMKPTSIPKCKDCESFKSKCAKADSDSPCCEEFVSSETSPWKKGSKFGGPIVKESWDTILLSRKDPRIRWYFVEPAQYFPYFAQSVPITFFDDTVKKSKKDIETAWGFLFVAPGFKNTPAVLAILDPNKSAIKILCEEGNKGQPLHVEWSEYESKGLVLFDSFAPKTKNYVLAMILANPSQETLHEIEQRGLIEMYVEDGLREACRKELVGA